ncbi:MAG: hypothetical protein ACLFTI_05280 [Anaerolineales bacterium]
MRIVRRIIGLILFLFGFYVGLVVGGAATLITCERVTADRVDCATQPAPLGIPVSAGTMHTLPDVQHVTTVDVDYLGRNFQLVFETSEETVSLHEEMTVNEQETAERINVFLQNPAADALWINYVDWVRVAVGIFVVGGILGGYPGLYLLFRGFWRDLFRRLDWRLALSAILSLFAIFYIVVLLRVTTVTCTRVSADRVDCRQEETWAGWLPVGEPLPIPEARGATTDSRRSASATRRSQRSVFYLKVSTADGVAAAIEYFSRSAAQKDAEQINAFIADPDLNMETVAVNNLSPATTYLVIFLVLATIVLNVFFVRWYIRDS